jgi:hypothetical protein
LEVVDYVEFVAPNDITASRYVTLSIQIYAA